jgi:two-component system, NtrC family, sensor kinase
VNREENIGFRNSPQTISSNTVLYLGGDTDGVVRDGAFRARVAVASAIRFQPGEDVGFVAAFLSSEIDDLESSIEKIRRQDSLVPIWIVGPTSSNAIAGESLMRIVNEFRIRRWISRDAGVVEAAIRESLSEREARMTALKSRRELGLKNRQLHDLQENLEKIVTERTSYLSDAERELHLRTQSTRDLVRFIKELSQAESIEELLLLLNQEVRSFHEVRSPILAVVSPEFGARLHFQQARPSGGKTSARALEKGWGSKSAKDLWAHRAAIRISDVDDQLYLAHELGRAVARTISIPLGRDGRPGSEMTSHTNRVAAPVLFFEHDFDETKAERFKKFLVPRLEPLSTALDRIIINREMHAASRLWEATFDGITDPIAVIGSNHEVLRMNEAFARHAGPGRRLCYEVFADRKTPCEGCQLKVVVREARHVEWQVRRTNDVYEVNGYPIRFAKDFDEDKTVRTVIHHYADVTKSLELKGHAFQGEKMAAIGLMAGNIAHELNNPLAGLRSLAQVLSVEPDYPESVKEDMRQIESAAERSSAIIRDLLEFSRADDRVRELISLNEIADRALNMVKTALHEHRVDQEWAENASTMVEVDPHLLQHVIFNIVNNACQAMREPGEITMQTRFVSGEKPWVEIMISDTGPGIPADIQSRIFEPFFTTKEAGQGTGLGLSMSRWIVENSGGTISVANRTDRSGTIFTVRLPRAAGTASSKVKR